MVTRMSDVTMEGAPPREASGSQRGERILYVVSAFPCWSETFIVREINALLRRGADVRILPLRAGTESFVQTDAARLMDRVLHPLPWYRSLATLLQRLVTQPLVTVSQPAKIIAGLWRKPLVMAKSLVGWFRAVGLLDDVQAFSPDHVHAHWATYASTAAMVISRHIDRPFSFTAHAHDIYLDDQLMADKLASAAFVATISEFNRAYIRHRYPASAGTRIEIVHCGVQPQRRRRDAARVQPGLLLSVGRLDEIKGFPVLIEACRILREQGLDFRCEIVGDGPLHGQLVEQLRRTGLGDRVTLLGALPSQDVERKLHEADVFVLASQRSRAGNMDGIPVALMEAMASGTPVISTAVSGIPELVEDSRTGLLVEPRDADALAHAIRRMLEDSLLRGRCVAGAVNKVRYEFNADTEGERLFHIIRSLPGEMHAKKTADTD